MIFIDAVNRVLRIEGVIAGDDDNLANFSDTQHENMSNLAQIAIQDEINDLVSDAVFPKEQAIAFITLSTGVRAYALATDFVRMTDKFWNLQKVETATSTGTATGHRIYPWNGGEENLRRFSHDYRTVQGSTAFVYFTDVPTTTSQVGVYPLPNSDVSGDIYRYFYDKDVSVTSESDVIPVITTQAAQAFTEAAAIRFRYIRLAPEVREALYPSGIGQNPGLQQARARVFEFVRRESPSGMYGRRYT